MMFKYSPTYYKYINNHWKNSQQSRILNINQGVNKSEALKFFWKKLDLLLGEVDYFFIIKHLVYQTIFIDALLFSIP